MNFILHNIFSFKPTSKAKLLLISLTAVGMLALSSCGSNENLEPAETEGATMRHEPVMELPLGFTGDNQRTRAFDFNNRSLTLSNINEIWVGLFDTEDHKIVGFGTKTGTITTPLSVTIENLFMSDINDKAWCAAVANYNGVNARLGEGELKPLIDILRYDVATWEDFCNVAIDVESAELAIRVTGSHVLMSGIFAADGNDVYVEHDSDDTGLLMPSSNIGSYTLYNKTFSAYEFETVISIYSNNPAVASYLSLRPMFAHVKVNVDITAPTLNANGNLQWKLYNVPKYVYLIEHANISDCSGYDNLSWLGVTPSAADLYYDGYADMQNYVAYNTPTPPTDALVDVIAGDVAKSGTTFSFGFWHYENKHWGLPTVTGYIDRDRMLTSTPERIFSALCPSDALDFNNKATYLMISIPTTSGGNAEYIIHEGYSSNFNNSANSAEPRDFSTFRNTDYTYNITVSGTSSSLKPAIAGQENSAITVETSRSVGVGRP